MSDPIYGGVEAGGTKVVCLVGSGPEHLLAELRVPTTSPDETLGRVVGFFRDAASRHGPCAAFGVASFGPLDLDPASPTWGRIARTPKPGWSGVDLVAPLAAAFGRPVAIDTDVYGAGLGELLWGAGRALDRLVYVTVGTGIGGAGVDRRPTLPGAGHPEMGHLRVPRHPDDTAFAGLCPFHGDCLEGLACGPAAQARWGAPLDTLEEEHPAWEVLGFYLGHLAAAATLLLAPQRVVIGGGVAKNPPLLPAVRRSTARLLAGYPEVPGRSGDLATYLVPPALGDRAGALGALALAARALAKP